MAQLSQEQALRKITELIDSIPDVKAAGRQTAKHNRWLNNGLSLLKNVFGESSMFFTQLDNFTWSETGSMIIHDARNYDYEVSQRHANAFVRQLEAAKGLLLSVRDQIEQDGVYQSNTSNSDAASEIIRVLNIGNSKLRKVIRTTPSMEKEIQDSFENLLIGAEIKYSREFPRIEYSSKQYVPDFSFPDYDLIVEIKLCKDSPKLLIAQINDDILAYKTEFHNIIFIVYDIGQIRDADIFKESFEKNEAVFVQIVKH
ncbi:PD-(D/E)XK nuclease domain-containing protein [Dyadobacter psychrotolerans]|nr:hypothetical protein [Dyadobacter psychrotolerans]